MMSSIRPKHILLLCLIFPLAACVQSEADADLSGIYAVGVYDPGRDPFQDLVAAILQAEKESKHIIIEAGGDWCVWCHILDEYIRTHSQVASALREGFLIVKVNFSQENYNPQFFSKFPPAQGYPHFFVLDQHGDLLHSQDTAQLEDGRSYDELAFLAFLAEWIP